MAYVLAGLVAGTLFLLWMVSEICDAVFTPGTANLVAALVGLPIGIAAMLAWQHVVQREWERRER